MADNRLFDGVSRPNGYNIFVHIMAPSPRKKAVPLVDGGQVEQTHGYTQDKKVFIRFATREEVEELILSHETDGYTRESAPNIETEVGPEVGLYKCDIILRRFTATEE